MSSLSAVADRELGDFQTPLELAQAVCACPELSGRRFTRLLEPTCGLGHFLQAGLARPGIVEAIGIELQSAHARAARKALGARAKIINGDVFSQDLSALHWRSDGPLLVLGNPPWVTSAEIGAAGGSNLPEKRNFKGQAGLEAMTGASNFDLAEAVLLRLLQLPGSPTLALLCKLSSAQRVLDEIHRQGRGIRHASIRLIDASRWFDAAVSACLLVLDLRPGAPLAELPVFPNLTSLKPSRQIRLGAQGPVADAELYRAVSHLDGQFTGTWRQGVKHDAAAIMELRREEGVWKNGLAETVEIEEEHCPPLLKGIDLRHPERSAAPRALVLPQRHPGEDTASLEERAPKLWSYLRRHSERLDRRRSTIYTKAPRFAVFGVGPYTFSSWKIMVCGLDRAAHFSLVGPRAGRPVLCDDTCYLLPVSDEDTGRRLLAALDSPPVRQLIAALMPPGAKRPVTKRLLQRLDLAALDGAKTIP